jgi:hypothetical protein
MRMTKLGQPFRDLGHGAFEGGQVVPPFESNGDEPRLLLQRWRYPVAVIAGHSTQCRRLPSAS